jgi:DNA-binding MarR family transcriptional regulator
MPESIISIRIVRIRTSDSEAGFTIDESLGYLVNQLAKKLTARFNERLAEHALTTTQWGVLACLWREDGLSQRELSRRTGTDPATLTEMLKRMEARGLVSRVRDPDNNRLQRVYIASRDATLRDILTAGATEVNRLATADFSDDERAELLRLLRRALSNIAPETLPATATANATASDTAAAAAAATPAPLGARHDRNARQ